MNYVMRIIPNFIVNILLLNTNKCNYFSTSKQQKKSIINEKQINLQIFKSILQQSKHKSGFNITSERK